LIGRLSIETVNPLRLYVEHSSFLQFDLVESESNRSGTSVVQRESCSGEIVGEIFGGAVAVRESKLSRGFRSKIRRRRGKHSSSEVVEGVNERRTSDDLGKKSDRFLSLRIRYIDGSTSGNRLESFDDGFRRIVLV